LTIPKLWLVAHPILKTVAPGSRLPDKKTFSSVKISVGPSWFPSILCGLISFVFFQRNTVAPGRKERQEFGYFVRYSEVLEENS